MMKKIKVKLMVCGFDCCCKDLFVKVKLKLNLKVGDK